MSHDFDKLLKHQDGKRQEVQPGECFRQSLIISCQSPEACRPAERALNHPSAWQQHKTFFRFRKFHHFQANAMRGGFVGSTRARIALVNKSQFYALTCYRLHLTRQLSDLCAVLFVGRCDHQRQQVTECVNRNMRLVTFASLGSVVGGATARFRRGLKRARVEYGCRRLRACVRRRLSRLHANRGQSQQRHRL